MAKIFLRYIGILFASLSVLALGACGADSSKSEMRFSFNTATPSDSNDVQSIYLNEDMDVLTLKGDVKLNSGEVTVSVVDAAADSAGEALWSGDFNEDTAFNIVLKDLKKANEYLVKVGASDATTMDLKLTSDVKLVLDKETPEKPRVDI